MGILSATFHAAATVGKGTIAFMTGTGAVMMATYSDFDPGYLGISFGLATGTVLLLASASNSFDLCAQALAGEDEREATEPTAEHFSGRTLDQDSPMMWASETMPYDHHREQPVCDRMPRDLHPNHSPPIELKMNPCPDTFSQKPTLP